MSIRIPSTISNALTARSLIASLVVVLAIQSAPAPAGEPAPFAVGSMTRFFHDDGRPFDSVAGVDSGVRVLLTEIWYPVDHEDVRRSCTHPTYGDYVFGDRDAHRRLMTESVTRALTAANARDGVSQSRIDRAIERLFSTPRKSCFEARLARRESGFPVVVLSHGDGGTRYSIESTAEELAAHGYIVFAPEHAGNASFAMTGRDPAYETDPRFAEKMAAVRALHDQHGAYGLPENLGQSIPRGEPGALTPEILILLDDMLMQRVNDLRAILDILPQLGEVGFFSGAIDTGRIGLMGRSLGGATTLAALGLEPRFAAGVAVVAPSVPDFRSALPREILAPEGEESVMLSSSPPFPLARLTRPTFLLSSGQDSLIAGINLGLAAAFNTPMPTADNPHPVLREAFESSRAPVVWGNFVNGDHGTLNVSGPYWWPELRPNRLPLTFSPDELYTLFPAALAHEIQAEKVRLFFDLTVKGDRTAKEPLSYNPAESLGFELEARNLD
jgi:dienelactone hydrolase